MAVERRANPVLERGFRAAQVDLGMLRSGYEDVATAPATMTVRGTAEKTMFLLGILTISGVIAAALGELGFVLALPCLLAAFVIAIVLMFKPMLAPKLAIPYAVLEGVVVGALSSLYARSYGGGIVLQALLLTGGILAGLLVAYRSGRIQVTDKLRMGIIAATCGVMLFHLVALVGSFVGFQVPLLWSNGPWGIAFSVVIVIIAASNLLLDFEFIARGAAEGAPKQLEWFGAFGLILTLVWLYLELLRLLAKLKD